MEPFPDLPGFRYWPRRLNAAAQAALRVQIEAALVIAPLYRPQTPG